MKVVHAYPSMPPPPEKGPLRIRGVAEVTGVAAPTLRAWERRYGVPAPERTASSYRLYGEAEVREIERMRDLCASGIAAAQAAATVIDERAARAVKESGGTGFERSVERLFTATKHLDAQAFDHELAAAAELGSASTVFESIVCPTLKRIGDEWECGDLSIAVEHFASARIAHFVRSRLRVIESSDPSSAKALLASFDGDDHATPLLGVALRFATWGYRTIDLGARTPPIAVQNAIAIARPAIVALSITLPIDAGRARQLARDYGEAAGTVPWLVGGAGIDSVAHHVEKHGGMVCREPLANLHGIVRKALAARRKSERRTP